LWCYQTAFNIELDALGDDMFEDEGLLDDAVSAPSAPQGEIGEPSNRRAANETQIKFKPCTSIVLRVLYRKVFGFGDTVQ